MGTFYLNILSIYVFIHRHVYYRLLLVWFHIYFLDILTVFIFCNFPSPSFVFIYLFPSYLEASLSHFPDQITGTLLFSPLLFPYLLTPENFPFWFFCVLKLLQVMFSYMNIWKEEPSIREKIHFIFWILGYLTQYFINILTTCSWKLTETYAKLKWLKVYRALWKVHDVTRNKSANIINIHLSCAI